MAKRLSISKGAIRPPDKRPALISNLPKKDYETFKGAVGRLCDDILKFDLTPEQKEKVAWLRARVIIKL